MEESPMQDIQALLTSTTEEVLAASGSLEHSFPNSIAKSFVAVNGKDL
jgi:hypothetical protein